MMPSMRQERFAQARIATLACVLLSGCQTLGPQTVVAGRAAYNDVIARTSSEQTLGLIVRIRYGDPIGLLAVSSVTANLKFSAQATAQFGIGSKSNYSGNLVPFSAGVGYEDSPTISYLPVAGQSFLTEWLKPISLDTVILSVQVAGRGAGIFGLTVDRLNSLRSGGDASPAQRAAFSRAVRLLDELHGLGVADWVPPDEPNGKYELVISGYAPAHTAQVEELVTLLGTPASTQGGAEIRIAASLSSQSHGDAGLAFGTRSVGEILRGAAQGISVPKEHLKAGVVAPSPDDGGGVGLRIRSSRDAPSTASLAVQHRGWWYYVDDTDLESKQVFQQIQMLFLSAIAEASDSSHAAPVLTIPVR
jgi:hypothetical protein